MKFISSIFTFLLSISLLQAQNAQEARDLLNEVKAKTQSYTNQKITFTNTLEVPNSNPDKPVTKRSMNGIISVKGDAYRLEMGDLVYIFDTKKLHIIDPDIEEVDITVLDEDVPLSPTSILNEFDKGYSLKISGTKMVNGKKLTLVNLKPIGASDIVDVELGIYADSKQLYSYKMLGMNKVVTILTITDYQTNLDMPANTFTFNKSDWPNYYINE